MNTHAISSCQETTRTETQTAATPTTDAWTQLQFASLMQSSPTPSWNPNRADEDEDESA